MAITARKGGTVGTLALAVMMSAVILSGCSTTAGVEAGGKTVWNDEGARELSKKVVFNSSSLAGDLQVVDLQSALAGNLMRAQATLRSRDRDTISLQYRFDWYDANGIEINSGSGSWKPLILTGKETKTVQGVAPDPRAKEFKLKVREADK
jgi:uncharacterized protein YcfL